ncbi:MAG: hypothetical protein HY671_08810 [Chloroflexi bacterium]|nr:hypothetical protein [Chloroflexota bacterium]
MAKKTTGGKGTKISSKAPVKKVSSVEKVKKQAQGHASDAKGLRFEMDVMAAYDKKGWKCTPRYKFRDLEIDIYGKKDDSWEGVSYLLVECKGKEHVTASDVMRFMKKVGQFYKSLPEDYVGDKAGVTAVLAHTGTVNADALDVGKSHKPRIQFKKF